MTKYVKSILCVGLACVLVTPALAKLSEKEKKRLQNQQQVAESINRDWQGVNRDLDRAEKAARAGDFVLKVSSARIPGGAAAYRAGKAAGAAAAKAYQKRKK